MKKICIIGYSDTIFKAPYNDPEWEIWAMNFPVRPVFRADKWFELHDPDYIAEQIRNAHYPQPIHKFKKSMRYMKYAQRLHEMGDNVFVCSKNHYFPNAEVFPRDDIVQSLNSNFFTNTVSWLIAYAIYIGAKTIGLWGVDMVHKTEYLEQRASVLYFLGLAKGLGIEIILPHECQLFHMKQEYWNL